METKICSKCGNPKKIGEFRKRTDRKEGFHSWCRGCSNIAAKNYIRTTEGLITKIYGSQRGSSKHRGHPMPNYSNKDLLRVAVHSIEFYVIYDIWVASGYKKMLVPSFDREKDYKPYTLDNIKISTWEKNKRNGESDHKKGKLFFDQTPVTGINIQTGKSILFHSIMEAERQTGIAHSSISKVCKGKLNYAGNYYWKYI